MKRIGILLLTILLSVTAVVAQKVIYDDNVQKRSVGSFSGIETSSGIEVVISKGDKEELAVSANKPEYLDEVRTIVQGGVLKIYRTDDWKLWRQWKNWRIKVYVSYTKLDEVKASSGGSISGTDINLSSLTVKLSSGATMNLSGKVDALDVDGSSGAQFRGYSLSTTKCRADVSSGAGIQVTVDKELTAKASSGGYIRFKGEGLIRDINANSGGSVKRSE
jgi:hypothetical protein